MLGLVLMAGVGECATDRMENFVLKKTSKPKLLLLESEEIKVSETDMLFFSVTR